MSGVIENIEANIEDLRNEVAKLKRKVEALEGGKGRSASEILANAGEAIKRGAKNMQQRRDAIVERAKADFEELKDSTGSITARRGYREGESEIICDADFITNKEKRTVVCLMRGQMSKEVYAKGIAKCAPNDCFNAHLGRVIALRRALGLEVPSEYLNAPQPTEVRVGDVCETHDIDGDAWEIRVDSEAVQDKFNEDIARNRYGTKVIDDSREGVSE